MAVEIPVVIDIEGAFEDAAKRVKTAMKPLQDVIDSAPASLFIEVNVGQSKKLLVELFDDAKTSTAQFQSALDQINLKIEKIAAKGGFNLLGTGLKEEEKNLLEAASLLETKLKGVGNASSSMGRVLSINIQRAEDDIISYTHQIDELTRKQNRLSKTARLNGLSSQYQDQINETNAKISQTRSFLAACSVELDKINGKATKSAASFTAIRTAGEEMAASFRRGSEYVKRWNAGLAQSGSHLASLIKGSITLVGLHAATRFVQNIRTVTSEFEMQRVALGGIIQDTAQAEELFKKLKAAAIQSPFEIKDLVTYTKQLSAYQIETDKLFDTTMKLADVSAGLGVDMNRIILAYGQVRAASVLRGQELRQFTEAGIPLVEKLAEKFEELGRKGTTTADVFELISKRAVPFSMIEDIFNDMTSAGGMFYKMQEKQSETLKGQWMKLKDALSIMYDEIGNTKVVHTAMESLLKDAMELMQNWREIGKYIGVVVAAMGAYKIAIINARIAQNALTAAEVSQISALELNAVARNRLIASLFGEAAATKVQITLGNLYVKTKTKEMLATNLFTKSLYKMVAAMLANPYAVMIAGIAALVAVLIKFTQKAKEATISNDELQKSVASFNKAKTHTKEIEDLCDAYDKLSEKTDKSRKDEEKLERVTKELAKLYPNSIKGVNEHTKAIELDTEAIRERNKEVEVAIRLSYQEDKARAEKRIGQLQNEYNRISEILQRGTIQKGAYGATWFEPITEEDRKKFGKRLVEIETELGDYKQTMDGVVESQEEFSDAMVNYPQPPDFFGDAWRTKMSSYSVLLTDAKDKTSAFAKDQIEKFKSSEEAVEEAAKQYKELAKSVDFYTRALDKATGAQYDQMYAARRDAILMRDMYGQILTDANAWYLVEEKKPHTSYKQDPFIVKMQERIKFMQDFKKGYDDLNQYMTSTEAKMEQSEIMLGRGQSLGLDADQQLRAVKDLSGWYEEMIETVQDKLREKGIRGASITDFLGVDTTKKSKAIQDLQKLLQSLWDAKTDYDTSQKKKDIEEALQQLSDEIKRSETARNFYQNILDLTGDHEMAATMSVSVYGDVGKEFKERLQDSLEAAFAHFDDGGNLNLWHKMNEAVMKGDFDTIMKYIDRFPPEWQKRLKEMSDMDQKHNAELAQNILKSLQTAKTYSDKRVDIARQAAKRIAEINALKIPESQKEDLRKQSAKKEAEETAKLAYEAFKETPMYIELFADLDQASSKMLKSMRGNLSSMKKEWQEDLSPTELRELQSRLNELDKQLARKNPFQSLINSIREYRELTKQGNRQEADAAAVNLTNYADSQKELLSLAQQRYDEAVKLHGINSAEAQIAKDERDIQKEETDLAIQQADAAQELASKWRLAAKHIADAGEAMQEWAGYIETSLNGIGAIIDTFASDDTASYFNTISDGIGKTLSGAGKMAVAATQGLAGIPTLVSGVSDVIVGIFGSISKLKIESINKKIEKQQELIDDLEYSYGRLENAIAKAFGSDYIYNYNQQLENLMAKQAAYEEQARLESDKGKKKDAEKIKEYENAARDVQDQIAEMKSQLSEFFIGTDVTSAAEDFANAWIDAYKEFGSTTDAMKEKFSDMVQNMVQKSIAAKLMEEILAPLFKQIDEMAQSDAMLTADEIAQIGEQAPVYIDKINEAMTGLMNQLGAAGYNMRQQVGGFTGISRNIAGATEESINGLAAGINTQNFYISNINQNVATILSLLSGGSVSPVTVGGPSAEVPDPYKDNMLLYASSIPVMRDDMSAIRSMLDKVVKPAGVKATHYVATNA